MARPVLVSEREIAHRWPDGRDDDSHWEDCAWCALLMLGNAITGGKYPATHEYAELMRSKVMGPLLGSTSQQLLAGARASWGMTPIAISGYADFATLWDALIPGTAAAPMGVLAALPDGNHLRRWQPGYLGGHAVFVQREDASDRVWWMDPLATTGYAGEWASKAELAAYYGALRGSSTATLIGPIAGGSSDMGYSEVREILPAPNPRAWTAAPGAVVSFYDPKRPGAAIFNATWPNGHTGHASHLVALDWPPDQRKVPDSGGNFAFLRVVKDDDPTNDVYDGLRIPLAAVTLAPAGPVVASQDDLAAAALVAAGKAKDETKTAAIAIGRGAVTALEAL